MAREIERKFLVKQIPAVKQRGSRSKIVQGYLPIASRKLQIRLRRKDSKYLLTVKRGRGLNRQEEEIEIPKERFRALWPLTRGARISKSRYQISCGPRIIELDVYNGRHRGLVTADVEFESERQSKTFVPPAWLAREITGSRSYANQTLARGQGVARKLRKATAH
jgi:CYTH domain-containing protein